MGPKALFLFLSLSFDATNSSLYMSESKLEVLPDDSPVVVSEAVAAGATSVFFISRFLQKVC